MRICALYHFASITSTKKIDVSDAMGTTYDAEQTSITAVETAVGFLQQGERYTTASPVDGAPFNIGLICNFLSFYLLESRKIRSVHC